MEFQVLGKLEVRRDGDPVDLGAFRQRALLALLLISPNLVRSTDQIIDELWGGEAGSDRQNALWVYVSGLRKALEPDRKARSDGTVLLTRSPGYLLRAEPGQIDSLRFEQLVTEGRSLVHIDPAAATVVLGEALALWHGHAYEEFTYESFAEVEIARLEELRLEAVEARIEADLACGRSRELVSELETLVRQHPSREELTGQWMRALYRSGRQAEALRAYQLLSSRLGDELGVEPSAPLRRLHDQIVVGDDALDAHLTSPASVGAAPGLAIRGYELREQIGEGAFEVAYRAYQPAVGREVAIKVIRPALANDPNFIRRFEAEAQLVARLEHPHIVPMYDYWREPDAAYLVMRLMRGGSLAEVLTERPLTPAQATVVADQLSAAVDVAHRSGVVHRDIKPANVLIDDDGNAYLSDFGIAVGDDGDPSVVGSGTSTLTPPYASPEQLDHEPITATSDVYSLGVVMAQAMTGLPGGVEQIRGALPPPVARVIDRATAPDASLRYDRVVAFAADLHHALGDQDPAVGPVADVANPYKGLRAFDAADAAEFYGRERLVDRLVAHLGTSGSCGRFLAVVGPSGSGKSSVVKAGLLPAVRRGALPQSSRWFTAQMTPAPHPFDALESELLSVAVNPPASLFEVLTGSERGLTKALRSVLPADDSQLLLVIDQFEELFTQVAPSVATHFLDVLVNAITADHSRLRVVVTLRADFYDRPLRHRGIGELFHDGTQVITPMTPDQLERAVTGPVEPLGISFEPALIAELIRDVLDRPGALPLLQYTLTELFDHRQGNRITTAAYRELGGVSGALVKRAEGLLTGLDDGARDAARQVFLRLVTFGDDGDNETRRRVLQNELEQLDIAPGDVRAVLDTFGRHRLLSFDCDAVTRGPTVEIAHEALLTEWTRLGAWMDDARQDVRNQRRLADAMREWDAAGRDDQYLLRDGRLELLRGWASTTTLRLSTPEQDYLDASVAERDRAAANERARQRRINRRLRRSLIAAVCLLAFAAGAGLFAFSQRKHAESSRRGAEITTLANRSFALRASKRDTAALLAVEAYRLRADSDSSSALFGTFSRDPGFLGYSTYDGARVEGAVVPNTNTAVITIPSPSPLEADPPLRLVDLATGILGPPFEPIGPHDSDVKVAVSGDGGVAVAFASQRVNFEPQPPEIVAFDISTGTAIGPRIKVSSRYATFNVAVNGDGSQAAVAGGDDGATQIFDIATGKRLTVIEPASDMQPSDFGRDTASAGWAPDGQLYVGSSGTHLRQFDPVTFKLVREISVPMYATGGLLKFARDGEFLVARGVTDVDREQRGAVARVDLVDGSTTWTIPPNEYGFGQCDSVAFSEREDRLWCGDYFGVIRGRSLTTGELDGTSVEHQRGWLSSLDVATVDGESYLVALGRNSPFIGRWQVDGSGPITRNIADGYDFATYGPDGNRLLLFGGSDAPPGFIASISEEGGEPRRLELPPNALTVAWIDASTVGVGLDDGRVRVTDVHSGDAREVRIDVEPDWSGFARIADGRWAFGYADGHVDVFDLATGERQLRLQISIPGWSSPPGVNQIAASADGERIYVTASGVYEFDASDGRLLQRNVDTSIGPLAVAADGPIAVGHVDGTISLLDPDDLSVVATLPGARALHSTLRFSADGRVLFAQSVDGTMSLYDVETHERLGDPVTIGRGSADLRPDGLEIAVAHEDASAITLWDLDPQAWMDAACTVAGRNLTLAEWDTYVGDLASHRATCPDQPFPPP